jgi:hypothetical protein
VEKGHNPDFAFFSFFVYLIRDRMRLILVQYGFSILF